MSLNFVLAENAVTHFFRYKYWTLEEYAALQRFYATGDLEKTWKAKLRLLYEENNDVIVSAVFADAKPEEQTFFYDKYRRDYSFVKISMKLNVHQNGLRRWRDRILSDIASLMNYKLPISDIFSRNKIEALIFVLERVISFHLSCGHYDPNALNILKERLIKYHHLLFIIRQFIEFDSNNIGVKIIRAKILNPSMSNVELAKSVNSSHTTINKYIDIFQEKFYPF